MNLLPCKAVSEEGTCGLTLRMLVFNPGEPFSCHAMWKGEGQTIKLNWYILYSRLSYLSLIYAPLPNTV